MSDVNTAAQAEIQTMIKLVARTVFEVTSRCDPSGSFTEDFDEVLAETIAVLGKKGGEVLDPDGFTERIVDRLEKGESLIEIAEDMDEEYMERRMMLSTAYTIGINALIELKEEAAK